MKQFTLLYDFALYLFTNVEYYSVITELITHNHAYFDEHSAACYNRSVGVANRIIKISYGQHQLAVRPNVNHSLYETDNNVIGAWTNLVG